MNDTDRTAEVLHAKLDLILQSEKYGKHYIRTITQMLDAMMSTIQASQIPYDKTGT